MAPSAKPVDKQQHMVRIYNNAPGQAIRMRDGAKYVVSGDGAFVRMNKAKLTKKERNKLKRSA